MLLKQKRLPLTMRQTKPLQTVLSDEAITTLKGYEEFGHKTVRIKAEALLLLNLGMDHQGAGSFVGRAASTIKGESPVWWAPRDRPADKQRGMDRLRCQGGACRA